MIKTLFYLSKFIEQNGVVITLGLANLALLGFCFWKLFTNHLKHIQEDITQNGVKIDSLDKDVRKVEKKVAKIEGKLEK